jgi:hypothetical protein
MKNMAAKRSGEESTVRDFIAVITGLSGTEKRANGQRTRWRRLALKVSMADAFGTGSAIFAAILWPTGA